MTPNRELEDLDRKKVLSDRWCALRSRTSLVSSSEIRGDAVGDQGSDGGLLTINPLRHSNDNTSPRSHDLWKHTTSSLNALMHTLVAKRHCESLSRTHHILTNPSDNINQQKLSSSSSTDDDDNSWPVISRVSTMVRLSAGVVLS